MHDVRAMDVPPARSLPPSESCPPPTHNARRPCSAALSRLPTRVGCRATVGTIGKGCTARGRGWIWVDGGTHSSFARCYFDATSRTTDGALCDEADAPGTLVRRTGASQPHSRGQWHGARGARGAVAAAGARAGWGNARTLTWLGQIPRGLPRRAPPSSGIQNAGFPGFVWGRACGLRCRDGAETDAAAMPWNTISTHNRKVAHLRRWQVQQRRRRLWASSPTTGPPSPAPASAHTAPLPSYSQPPLHPLS